MTEAILKFKEKHKNQLEIDHVVDFLKAEYSYKKSINFSYAQALEKANKWILNLNKKNENSIKEGEVEVVLDFNDGFKIVRLLDQDSKNYEGFYMKHCVASYEEHEGIYSLRDSNEIPHATIEVNESNKVLQIKGKANGKISFKYSNYIIDFLNKKKFDIKIGSLLNIGYAKPSYFDSQTVKLIQKHFSNYKIIDLGKDRFVCFLTKLKLEKPFPLFKSKYRILNYFREKKHSKYLRLFLYLCQFGQSEDALVSLIKNGIDINFKKAIAIQLAAVYGSINSVKILMKAGIEKSQINQELFDSLLDTNNVEMIRYLFPKGENVNPYKKSSIMFAKRGMVSYLVETFPSYQIPRKEIVMAAVKSQDIDLIKKVIQNQKDLEQAISISKNFNYDKIVSHLELMKFED